MATLLIQLKRGGSPASTVSPLDSDVTTPIPGNQEGESGESACST
jgi:hypothetical protein